MEHPLTKRRPVPLQKVLAQWKKWLPIALYGGFALVWLLGALLSFLAGRGRTPLPLNAATAVAKNLTLAAATAPVAPPLAFTSDSTDPKLIFENLHTPVRHVRLLADFATDPGEMDLFYTTREGQGFSTRGRVLGVPQADGSFLYTLPPFTGVLSLRIDLGTAGGNAIVLREIVLNPALPAAHFFAPTLRQLLGLAIWPALALCAIYIIIEGYLAAQSWRRGKEPV